MSEPAPSQPPGWIHKRDGRLVPFEADKISRALFAASESLDQPDAFLARELTDGVVHFLSAELEGAVPTTVQVAEMVVKVVRELGRPALAQAFVAAAGRKAPVADASGSPSAAEAALPDLIRDCVREYTLRTVFARDIVAAQGDGLLTLWGLENPMELAGRAVERAAASGWTEALIDARPLAGVMAAVEGLEYAAEPEPQAAATRIAHELQLGRRATGLGLVVNLNVAKPPSWADDLAAGPLFVEQRRPADPQRFAAVSDALLNVLVEHSLRECDQAPPTEGRTRGASALPVRINWHLSERDFLPEARERLVSVARHSLASAAMAFVFDRPRRPIDLAEGTDRRHPAALLAVGLHLPRLLDQPGVRADPELFLKKAGSLARLVLSAGVQKRDFLRRHSADRPALTRGFLLERARLVAVPIGLESVVRALTGEGLCQTAGLALARRIVERLAQVLREDGLACRLPVRLDSPFDALGFSEEDVGLTPRDTCATVKNQLKTAGVLHTAAESGTAIVFLSGESEATAEQVADWLGWAWAQTGVVRMRWASRAPAARQLTMPMDSGAS